MKKIVSNSQYVYSKPRLALSTYYLEYGCHVVRLRRRRRRRAYAPMSNTASHDNHEKINLWVSFSFSCEYGAPLLNVNQGVVRAKSFRNTIRYAGMMPVHIQEFSFFY